jgi:glycogen debranching enzyme
VTVEVHPYKVNHCFAHLDGNGFTARGTPRVAGVMLHDTRHVSDWHWDFAGFDLIEDRRDLTGFTQFWSRFVDHEQDLMVRRRFTLRHDGFDEDLTLICEALEPVTFTPRLTCDADFIDTFEQRGRVREIPKAPVARKDNGNGWTFTYRAQDGIDSATVVTLDGFVNGAPLTIAKGQSVRLHVSARFDSSLALPEGAPPPLVWSPKAQALRDSGPPAVQQAFADITALAATTADGTFIFAGIPNFVTTFGRDSLITAWFLLDAAPQVAAATLRHLGTHQGRVTDPFRQEEPGKIAHELRMGELSRMNDVPFARYYGTTDATMLYLIVLADYAARTGDMALVRELEPNWRAALAWIRGAQDGQGLVRYPAARDGKGLSHTSWKDSDDSVSYADGRLAAGRIAVVEIQGYTVAALRAAAALTELTGDDGAALRADASVLAATIDRLYWNDRLGLHVIAIDEGGQQCDTATSNPGHLLWAGVLGPERAEQVADRLMQPDLWTGWGLRTLSSQEARYKPLSYHNGSVWPHDTAIFAAGMARYGMADRAAVVAQALHDLAARQPGMQMPELCGGYDRRGDLPPLIYIETCRPQAWAAAAMIWLALTGA